MTYLLNNVQKIEMLKNNNISFSKTTNTIYVDGLDYTNISDQNFNELVNN